MSRSYDYYLSGIIEADHRRGFDRKSSHLRTLRESRVLRPWRLARSGAALARLIRRERHSMTSYPCRLPDGRIGRTSIVMVGGEWTAVCAVA